MALMLPWEAPNTVRPYANKSFLWGLDWCYTSNHGISHELTTPVSLLRYINSVYWWRVSPSTHEGLKGIATLNIHIFFVFFHNIECCWHNILKKMKCSILSVIFIFNSTNSLHFYNPFNTLTLFINYGYANIA